jgi:predicted transcriptional regulator
MYKANLSFTQLNDYIDFLLNDDLIRRTGSDAKEYYVITTKGLDFLHVHKELVQLLKA